MYLYKSHTPCIHCRDISLVATSDLNITTVLAALPTDKTHWYAFSDTSLSSDNVPAFAIDDRVVFGEAYTYIPQYVDYGQWLQVCTYS